MITSAACLGEQPGQNPVLTKRERESLEARFKEFNLKRHVIYWTLLADELIHPRLAKLASAIRAGMGSMIVARRSAIQFHPEANPRPIFGIAAISSPISLYKIVAPHRCGDKS